jgi:hypothetical protein
VRAAINTCKYTRSYHLLVVITAGQVNRLAFCCQRLNGFLMQIADMEATQRMLAAASDYPLSIVLIGVGDGPFVRPTRHRDATCD